MIPNYGETTYRILSKIVGLNFKAHIKISGIELKRIYKMTNLESGEETYLLVADNKSIRFKDKASFIQEFIMFLKANIVQFNEQFEELRRRETEAIVDSNAIYQEDEYIGYYGHNQLDLLNKMREFREKLGQSDSD